MIRSFSLAPVLLGLLTLSVPAAVAQEAHHPQISIAHKGVTQLKEDIKLFLDLSSSAERHWENWDGIIELMAFGLDYEKPVLFEVLSGLTPPPIVIYGAYGENVTDLLEDNIGANYVLRKISDTLYELLPPDLGWFRIIPGQKYAILVLSTEDDHSLLKQLIQKATNPVPIIVDVLKGDARVGVRLVNAAHTAEDQKKRTASFAEIRAVRMDALLKRPKETQTEFALRKGVSSVFLNEVERLMVESGTASATAFLNADEKTAKVVFSDDGIADTALAKSIGLYGQQPDAFASVAKAEGSALSLRINHPLDELRQKNSRELMELIRKDFAARLKANETMSADEKQAAQQVVDGVNALLTDGVATGNVNAFLESVPNKEGKFVSYGAIQAVDPKRLDETLALIAKTGKKNEVSIGIETVGGVSIHRIKLRKGFLKVFDKVFGEEANVYIGTSENMIWFGAGPDSLPALKAGIEGLGEPAESDVILRVTGDILPWAKRASEVVEGLPEPTTLDDQQARRDARLRLQQAVESFTDEDDDARFEMQAKDGTVTGEMFFNTGMLRFIGTQLETFSKNTLE